VDQSSQFFLLNPPWITLDQVCSRFLISQLVSKIFAVKLKSCVKSRQIFAVLPSQIFRVWAPKILYISDHADHMARHVAKFRGLTPSTLKVTGADTLNFKPILDPPLTKNVKGTPIPGGGCANKTWSFSTTCKNLGAQHPLETEIWSTESQFWQVRFHRSISMISGPKFIKLFHPTQ